VRAPSAGGRRSRHRAGRPRRARGAGRSRGRRRGGAGPRRRHATPTRAAGRERGCIRPRVRGARPRPGGNRAHPERGADTIDVADADVEAEPLAQRRLRRGARGGRHPAAVLFQPGPDRGRSLDACPRRPSTRAASPRSPTARHSRYAAVRLVRIPASAAASARERPLSIPATRRALAHRLSSMACLPFFSSGAGGVVVRRPCQGWAAVAHRWGCIPPQKGALRLGRSRC
jgi:hypothetical protein